LGRERLDRVALQLRRLVHGVAEEDRRDERMVLGEPERRRRSRLDPAEERGHDPAQPVGAGREHQVPAERIDRCASGDRGSIELGVHHRHLRQVRSDREHDRDRVDVREQVVVLVRRDVGGLDVVDDVERVAPGHRRLQVLVPHRLHERCQFPAQHPVLDNGDTPRLTVSTRGREPRVVEDARDRRIVDRFVGEVPDRAVGANRLANLHEQDVTPGV
jgi:hypothetical protein